VECFVNQKYKKTHIFFQALLSAHDTVSLRDYEPDLPALPKDLPEDEEAMRIVCLVKNNQPLVSMTKKEWQANLRLASTDLSFILALLMYIAGAFLSDKHGKRYNDKER